MSEIQGLQSLNILKYTYEFVALPPPETSESKRSCCPRVSIKYENIGIHSNITPSQVGAQN